MPKVPVPEHYHDLLASKSLGYLDTIGKDGRPQVNPVWFIADAHFVYLSVRPETAKYRNLRSNPAVAMAIGDPAQPDRYLEVRGEVIEFELYETLAWVNQLARKYTGSAYTRGVDGEPRYKVTIRIDGWTAQG